MVLTKGMQFALKEIGAGRPQLAHLRQAKALVARDLAWWTEGRVGGPIDLTEKGRRLLAD